MRASLLLLAALLAGGCAAPAGRQAPGLACESYRLPNGLTVILREDHRLPVAAVNLWYRVGSRDEAERRSGFAHLFEHLMFMGTDRVPSFDKVLEGGGASNNADTGQDRTDFYSSGPSAFLPTLLWVEADRLESLGRAMTQDKLNLQREVVLNERRQSCENAPYGKAELQVPGWMYPPEHPYAHPVIGSAEDIRASSVEDVKAFFATHYLPNNASLAVVGDFETARLKPLIASLFGGLSAGPQPPRPSALPPLLGGEVRRLEHDQVQQARLSWAWHSPAAFAPGDAEMDLAAMTLAGGRTSRLYRRLVEEDKLAQDVSAFQGSQALGSLFRLDVTALPEADPARIEAAVAGVLEAFLREGPTRQEMERNVAGLEARALRDLQDPAAVASRLNYYAECLGAPDGLARDLGRYRDATPAGVRDWARRVLDPRRRLVLTVLPEAPEAASPLDLRPEPFQEKPFTPPLPRVFTLPNGLKVWHLERHDLPLVSAVLKVGAGSGEDPQGRSGLAALTASMLTEGAGSLSAAQFQEALDRMGARLESSAGGDSASVGLHGLARHAGALFGLMDLAVRRPSFDAGAWERVKRLRLGALDQALDDPEEVARRLAAEAFYGASHPYGHPPAGLKDDVAAATLDEARAFWKGRYVPAGATLLVTGDLAPAELDRLLEGTLARWEASAPAPAAVATPHPGRRRLLLVDRPHAPQTVVRFVWPAPRRADEDRPALQVLNTLLGGSFLSRLNANLREKNGYTYGASSGLQVSRRDGCWVAGASVQTEVTGKSLGEFLKEFRRLPAGDIQPDELTRARATLRQGLVQDFLTLEGALGRLSEPVLHGEGPAALARDQAAMDACDAARLNRLAAALKPEEGVLVLVGDRAKILPQLEGLGLPEPEILAPR